MPEMIQDVGRVTAGNASLDPSRRFTLERRELAAEKQRAVLADAENKRQSAVAPDGSRSRVDNQQAGIWLSSAELTKRLLQMNAALIFKPSPFGSVGVYIPRTPDEFGDLLYLAGFDQVRVPEFTIVKVEEKKRWTHFGVQKTYQNCVGILPGWRTVVARLIKSRVITQTQVDRLFGPPSRDSRNWQIAMS